MNPPPDARPPLEAIEAAAAAWLSLRDRGMSSEETAAFMHWLQQDQRHAAVFAELDRVWRDCDQLAAVPSATSSPDADLLAPRLRARGRATAAWSALAAAAAIALVVTLLWPKAPAHTAETAVGSFQKLDLPDGSVALLNTDTALEVDFSGSERRIRLVRGEAFFNVTKDAARPFVVTSGSVAVRAVGTAFNVRRQIATVEVLVTEGRVRLNDAREGQSLLPPASPDPGAGPTLLVRGERAVVHLPASNVAPAPAMVEKISAPAASRALAWQERRLEFDAVPLAEVAREFNRYNRRQLVIADETLAVKRFSGTFRADGYESLVRLLELDFGASATRTEREIILRASP